MAITVVARANNKDSKIFIATPDGITTQGSDARLNINGTYQLVVRNSNFPPLINGAVHGLGENQVTVVIKPRTATIQGNDYEPVTKAIAAAGEMSFFVSPRRRFRK